MGFKDRSLSVVVSTDALASDLEELKGKLLDYNTSRVGPENYVGLLITLRDAESKLVGGVAGKFITNGSLLSGFGSPSRYAARGKAGSY